VAGIGLVGLIQMGIIGIVGVSVALIIGSLTISASAAFSTVVWLIVWFLLGFVMYSLVFAALRRWCPGRRRGRRRPAE